MVARDGNRPRRSQARTLLGVLAFSAVGQGGGPSELDRRSSTSTDAIRADPTNEAAKYDLELLLRLSAAKGVAVGPGPGRRSARRGAGRRRGRAGGSGY